MKPCKCKALHKALKDLMDFIDNPKEYGCTIYFGDADLKPDLFQRFEDAFDLIHSTKGA